MPDTPHTYLETFDDGPGGWFGWIDNARGPARLDVRDGVATSRSPWWIDYNHAPAPAGASGGGAGYLHMLFCLLTQGPAGEHHRETAGENRFVAGGFPTDFTDARFTIRIKGELEARGAQLVLLIQSTVNNLTSAWVLTGQPFRVSPEWTTQTITAAPDESQWTCLGARHDRGDFYGRLPLRTVLSDVNNDFMLILFPLDVVPMGPLAGDPHVLRPEKDYPVWRGRLPEGYVMLDEFRIESFAGDIRSPMAKR
jgi:hypothetical protein